MRTGRTLRAALPALLIMMVAAVGTPGSQAAAEPASLLQRTFVSTSGSDANPCTRAQPCRGFQAAIAQTAPGGEVVALDSGGYGKFIVHESMTIAGAPGKHVAVTAFADEVAVWVMAGATDTVVLRNLHLTGLGGATGIQFFSGGTLHVESVVATGFQNIGLAGAPAGSTLLVSDSTFRHNGTAGVFVGRGRVAVTGSRAERNGGVGFAFENGARGSISGSTAVRNAATGFWFRSGAIFTVSDSVAEGNAQAGIEARDEGTAVTLSSVTAANNNQGIFAFVDAAVRLAGSTVTGNQHGILAASDSLVESLGNNRVHGNTTNVSGTIVPIAPAGGGTTDSPPEPERAKPRDSMPEQGPQPLAETASTIQRTFVSTSGSDANPCTRAQPCRGFAAAIANTSAGGEVVALDSGGYGAFTVTKAITVAGAPGEHVAISGFSGTAVHVNAGAGDAVVLRNLYLTGLGATTGIWLQGGGSLYVESVVAGGFSSAGLQATASSATVFVRDSVFRHNGVTGVGITGSLRFEIAGSRADGNGEIGFTLASGARGSIIRSAARRNGLAGFRLEFGAVATLADSVADGNTGDGVSVFDVGTQAMLSGVVLTNNAGSGLLVAFSATAARIGRSTVSGNAFGVRRVSGLLETFASNLVRGNTTDASGTVVPVSPTGIGETESPAAPADARPPGREGPPPEAGPAPLPEVSSTIQRTFVSTEGSDANPCTRAQPCRGFAAAIANTTAGGEVVALDSGGYGPFSVNKAITVAGAPGEHVAVTAFSGTAVHVNAGTSDTVILRNLYLSGLGAETGIWFQAGGTLHVGSVVAAGFSQVGLHATAADASLLVRDSTFRNNGSQGVRVVGSLRAEIADSSADGNGLIGLVLHQGARGSIVRTQATRNGMHGFSFWLGAVFALDDSVADGNGLDGVNAEDLGTSVTLRSVVLSNNPVGLGVRIGSPLARISNSTVTGNGTGLFCFSGTLETLGDNMVRGNTTDVSGTISPVTPTGGTSSDVSPGSESRTGVEPVSAEPGPAPLPEVAATIQRTFVSTSGSDANPCTRAQPCRGFQAAIANTTAGGEVVALDSGGYGTFTVNKAITIAGAPGEHVAVTAFSGTAVHVNAGAGDAVILRNLYVTGLGAATGVWFQAGGTLHVESVVAAGFTSNGLLANAANASLIVRDSIFRHNGNGAVVSGTLRAEIAGSRADRNASRGFLLQSGARGSIVRSAATRNGDGFVFWFGAVVAVSDSVADGNASRGVEVLDPDTSVTLSGSVVGNNGGAGLHVGLSATAGRISGSVVTGNGIGLERSSGTLFTFGDNLVRGNATNTSGTITAVGKT